jgi:hypothetical protein
MAKKKPPSEPPKPPPKPPKPVSKPRVVQQHERMPAGLPKVKPTRRVVHPTVTMPRKRLPSVRPSYKARFQMLPGSARRYLDTQTGETLSRRQRDKLVYGAEYIAKRGKTVGGLAVDENALIFDKKIGQLQYNRMVNSYKHFQAGQTGKIPKVRGNSPEALLFKQYQKTLKDYFKARAAIDAEKRPKLRAKLIRELQKSDLWYDAKIALYQVGYSVPEFRKGDILYVGRE